MTDLSHIRKLIDAGSDEEARQELIALARSSPDDALLQLETAFIHDRLGYEKDAVGYYERAMQLGLPDAKLRKAYLTLGSTYRALGKYQQARETWLAGLEKFPLADEIRVFLAMGEYNLGENRQAVSRLLKLIAALTTDEHISQYQRAINFYADHLDEIWDN